MEQESVLQEPLYSAVEIAAMKVPGLPRSKPGVLARANAEGWRFENRTGVGGTKRMYEVPKKYLEAATANPAAPLEAAAQVVGMVAGGTNKVDTVKLELAIRALTEWEAEKGVKVTDDRRPAVIAILYDYLQNAPELNEGEKAMAVVLRALG